MVTDAASFVTRTTMPREIHRNSSITIEDGEEIILMLYLCGPDMAGAAGLPEQQGLL